MTVIAWDGKTLAADKLAVNGVTKTTVTKIHRVGGELVGYVGELTAGLELFGWYEAGAVPADFPQSVRDAKGGGSLVVVRSDRTVWKYEGCPMSFRLEGPFCAFGSGDESALIAMDCGKTAKEAVLIASKYNIYCGNGVDTLTLE